MAAIFAGCNPYIKLSDRLENIEMQLDILFESIKELSNKKG